MGIFDSVKYRFRQKDILIQLIIINVALFLLLALINVIAILFKIGNVSVVDNFVGVSSDISIFIRRPWTLFTYMFIHDYRGIFHILFNMLILFWFGQIFLSYFNSKNLASLYILGGFAGAIFYILLFNTIPYFVDMPRVPLVGASASVMAIIFAVAFYNPEQRINLLLFGSVKIIYIAIIFFVIDFISLANPDNPGGHGSHIGGAILGYLYAVQYRKGKDITRWVTRIIDGFANLFKKKQPKMKVKYKRTETDHEYNRRKHNEAEEIDRILDKIKASGYGSLTKDEKKRLFDASKK